MDNRRLTPRHVKLRRLFDVRATGMVLGATPNSVRHYARDGLHAIDPAEWLNSLGGSRV